MTHAIPSTHDWQATESASRHRATKPNAKTPGDATMQSLLANNVPLTTESLVVFKIPVLKMLAQGYGLKYGGTKAQLIARLVAFGGTQKMCEPSAVCNKKRGVPQTSRKVPALPEQDTQQSAQSGIVYPGLLPSACTLFPFHPSLNTPLNFFNCVCRGAIPNVPSLLIECRQCHASFHEVCMRSNDPNVNSLPSYSFLCPKCRFENLDPFYPVSELLWMTYIHRYMPQAVFHLADNSYSATTSFSLFRQDLHSWSDSNKHIIVRCIKLHHLITDHDILVHEWPRTLTIKVNQHSESVAPPRPDHKRRDCPMFLTHYLNPSQNHIEISVSDTHNATHNWQVYALAVLLCDCLNVPQLTRLVQEKSQASYEKAFERVLALVRPTSEDDDVLCDEKVHRFKLTCPITLTRIIVPARGRDCKHLQCFDLQSYLDVTKASKAFNNRWKCPECSLTVYPDMLVEDLFISRILKETHHMTGDIVEVSPAGHWKLLSSHNTLEEEKENALAHLNIHLQTTETSAEHNKAPLTTHVYPSAWKPCSPICIEDSDVDEEPVAQRRDPPSLPVPYNKVYTRTYNEKKIECINLCSTTTDDDDDDDLEDTPDDIQLIDNVVVQTRIQQRVKEKRASFSHKSTTPRSSATANPINSPSRFRYVKKKKRKQTHNDKHRKSKPSTSEAPQDSSFEAQAPLQQHCVSSRQPSSTVSSCASTYPPLWMESGPPYNDVFVLEAAKMLLLMGAWRPPCSSTPNPDFSVPTELHSTNDSSPSGVPLSFSLLHPSNVQSTSTPYSATPMSNALPGGTYTNGVGFPYSSNTTRTTDVMNSPTLRILLPNTSAELVLDTASREHTSSHVLAPTCTPSTTLETSPYIPQTSNFLASSGFPSHVQSAHARRRIHSYTSKPIH